MAVWQDAARDLHLAAGEKAKYVSTTTARTYDVVVVVSNPEQITRGAYGESFVQRYTAVECLKEEVAHPREGDLFRIQGQWMKVQGSPTLDSSRSIWTAGIVPKD